MARRAESGRGAGGSGSSGKIFGVLIGVAVLGGGILLWNIARTVTDESARQPVEVSYSSPQELIDLAEGVVSGDPNAPLTILEFADFQCPSCQAFWAQTKPILNLAYIETGQVKFVFHDFPLHEGHIHAYLAARAARCAEDQGQFWEYHDRLFQEQARWGSRADPMDDFLSYAGDLGLNEGQFESCVKSDEHAVKVSANRILGEQLNVRGTPTVLLDAGEGRPIQIENWSADGVRAAVDAALARLAERAAATETAP